MTMPFSSTPVPCGLPLVDVPIAGHSFSVVEEIIGGAKNPAETANTSRRYKNRCGGVHISLPENEGAGYWEVFKVAEHAFLSITDAIFAQDKTLDVPTQNGFKIRLLLRGAIEQDTTNLDLLAPQGVAYCAKGAQKARYVIKGGQRTTLILLHCRTPFIRDTVGANNPCLPEPFRLLTHKSLPREGGVRFSLTPSIMRSASDILEARLSMSPHLRQTYLFTKSLEIWTAVLQHLIDSNAPLPSVNLSQKDFYHVDRAREILQREFTNPPSVQMLARTLGVSATKLKSIFKAATANTLQGYLQRVRMEHAAFLLLQQELSVGQVAAEVGYEHQANFTHAFKRYFGYSPKQIRRPDANA